jgi:hypothetical protein
MVRVFVEFAFTLLTLSFLASDLLINLPRGIN